MTRPRGKSAKVTAQLSFLLFAVVVSTVLASCDMVRKVAGSAGSTGKEPAAGPATPAGSAGSKPPADDIDPRIKGKMAGYWNLGYQLNDNVYTSSIKLSQNGLTFSGEGTDDETSKPFTIEQGQIHGNQVIFFKHYDQPNNRRQTPVEYTGTLEVEGVPYMKGDFIVAMNGQHMSGVWEAEKQQEGSPNNPASKGSSEPAEKQEPPQPAMKPPDHAPDLSGKWTAGFEYKFKTVQSTMWLEQHGDKLAGHGIDHNTGEKFAIEKGWYAYPRVTIIRKYPRIKGKSGVIPEHTMTFKAEVSWVSDKDYQGPYMSGKTDGGGNWEAQLVR